MDIHIRIHHYYKNHREAEMEVEEGTEIHIHNHHYKNHREAEMEEEEGTEIHIHNHHYKNHWEAEMEEEMEEVMEEGTEVVEVTVTETEAHSDSVARCPSRAEYSARVKQCSKCASRRSVQ